MTPEQDPQEQINTLNQRLADASMIGIGLAAERGQLRAELETVKRQAAAMLQAVNYLSVVFTFTPNIREHVETLIDGGGHDFVPRAELETTQKELAEIKSLRSVMDALANALVECRDDLNDAYASYHLAESALAQYKKVIP